MKKLLVSLACMAVFIACQEKQVLEPEDHEIDTIFRSSMEDSDCFTKTSMTKDNDIVWSKGDRIAIFQGANVADTYMVKNECAGTSTGIFTLVSDNSDVNGDFSSGMEIPANIAVYPYMDGLGCSRASVSDDGMTSDSYTISGFEFPAVQQYSANSFPQESFTMVAVTSSMADHNLRFRNVIGALKLQLCGTCKVKSIKLEGNKEEKIAGAASITAFPGTDTPEISLSASAGKSITLDCGEGVQLSATEPTVFIIAAPPTKFIGGFTVTVTDTDGVEMPIKAYATNEIKRSSVLKMPAVTIPITEEDIPDNIVFEDEVMKEMCVKAFDTNGDGELSYAEAAAVTDLSKMTLTKKTFKKFNEFKYFTSVTYIPISYFKGIGITEITLPESLKNIDNYAFQGCPNLKYIIIPENVNRIGYGVFSNCTNLIEARIYGKIYSLSGHISSEKMGVFANCTSLVQIIIPESVTEIEGYALSGCSSLTNITIPDGVTYIAKGAFSGCTNLTSITLPESIKSIYNNVFYGCSSMTTIIIPESVTSIGDYAFSGCSSLASITIPESVTSIGDYAFSGCSSLASITIPESVTSISMYAFKGCSSLTSITIPESVTSVGSSAFSGCSSLMSITMPESVTSVGSSAFSGCSSLTSIIIPECVTSIENYAFRYCSSLTSITIPESVTSIGSEAFSGCSSLASITIPESVTSIGYYAFSGCSSLQSTYIKAPSLTSYGTNAFINCPTTIYVTLGSEETYKAGWPDYANRIVGYDYSAE